MEAKKPHRPSGDKQTSKKTKSHANGFNARAFAVANPGKLDRMARRSVEVGEKRLHTPQVDRTPEEAPPVLVAVVGPRGVGKSTLIRSLVRRFSKHNVQELNGCITVVTGKKRRVTFFECGCDLNSMTDVAKVADLVLLMIDGNFGFEMETMEFLQIASVHGFPRVLGIVTHLDLLKGMSQVKATKKALKNRFWTEVYKGAKLFYLSGVLNGRYPDREILNLARFISVMKFRPLKWRNEHPYLLADRITDLTHPATIEQNPKVDRDVAIYGYLRGTPLRPGQNAHIPGVGDVIVAQCEKLKDPCPTPAAVKREEGKDGTKGRRRLDDKLKTIYAPMSDVGGVMIDKDAVYIDVGTSNFDSEQNKSAGLGEKLVMDLQKGVQKPKESGIQLFSNTEAINSLTNGDESEGSDGENDGVDDVNDFEANEYLDEELDKNQTVNTGRTHLRTAQTDFNSRVAQNLPESDSDSDMMLSEGEDENEDASERKWMDNYSQPMESKRPLTKLIYSDMPVNEVLDLQISEPLAPASIEGIDDLFYREVKAGDEYEEEGSDFEDLEAEGEGNGDASGDEGSGDGSGSGGEDDIKSVEEQRALNAKRKEQMRLKFDSDEEKADADEDEFAESWYDKQKNKIGKQLEINEAELANLDLATRERVEGLRAGTYVRLVVEKLPYEFVENFDPKFPLIVGGLLANESRFGFSQVRFKKHRWHPKLLKTNDPVIISLGWRRFQTCPIYTTSDSRTRTRMLKYTPEHMFCTATLYGPLVSPNTGFACFPSVAEQDAKASFRVSATGTVEEIDAEVEIVKKLKLVGYPYKVFKNTAFIKDMFQSALEVARFEGAQIKTVSGIRGQIKKGLPQEGSYRATFEDKILMSDIIILRAWWPVHARKFYNPVTSLLLADKNEWKGMRLTGAVRFEKGLTVPQKKDSTYGAQIERETRRFNPLHVPKTLQKDLPFKSQIATMKPQSKQTYMQKRAVVLDGEEKQMRDLMVKVNTLRNEKDAKRQAKKQSQREARQKEQDKVNAAKEERRKEQRKEYFANEGRKRAAEEQSMNKKRKH